MTLITTFDIPWEDYTPSLKFVAFMTALNLALGSLIYLTPGPAKLRYFWVFFIPAASVAAVVYDEVLLSHGCSLFSVAPSSAPLVMVFYSTFTTLIWIRSTEYAAGGCPQNIDTPLRTIAYLALPCVEPDFNKPATPRYSGEALYQVLRSYIILTLVKSATRDEWILPEFASSSLPPPVSLLLDNFISAVVVQEVLNLHGNLFKGALQFVMVWGRPIMRQPLFFSQGPNDFWSRRWNMIVHVALKRGILFPMRAAGRSKAASYLAVFASSALLHEVWWITMFYRWE